MNRITREPYMMTIRQVARTGLLSEYALRKLIRENKLPVIYIGNRALINYTMLCEQLNKETSNNDGGDAFESTE